MLVNSAGSCVMLVNVAGACVMLANVAHSRVIEICKAWNRITGLSNINKLMEVYQIWSKFVNQSSQEIKIYEPSFISQYSLIK